MVGYILTNVGEIVRFHLALRKFSEILLPLKVSWFFALQRSHQRLILQISIMFKVQFEDSCVEILRLKNSFQEHSVIFQSLLWNEP